MDENKLKNLPLGIQTFKDIIDDNKLYVDKTKDIYELLKHKGKFFFLSRPRRFGKSLLISTLEQIFLGNQELFKDLWIYDKIEWEKHPVIRIDFTAMLYTDGIKAFKDSFFNKINSIAKSHKVKLESKNYKEAFNELIEKLGQKEKVVILIDEYDKPIINFIDKIEIAQEMRDILKNFYESIKSSDEYIRFAFLTGVSKFAKISVFSGLNNLSDITLDERFSNIVGITEKELFSYFDQRIELLAKKLNKSNQETKEDIKKWYNGYSWDGKNFVYNPYSILLLFDHELIKNYWFETATPTLLVNLIREYNIDVKKLENCLLSEEDFSTYEVDNMNVEALLFQTGYLTIKKIILDGYEKNYVLSYPNKEVKDSFLKYLLNDYIGKRLTNDISIRELVENLRKKNLDGFFNVLIAILGSIPNQIFPEEKNTITNKEAYYHTIFYLIFKLIGVKIQSELSVSKGRIDAVVETDDSIYIFEFKLKKSPEKAIKQIEDKEYYERFLASKKEIFMIGVNFSVSKRNIKNYSVKKLVV